MNIDPTNGPVSASLEVLSRADHAGGDHTSGSPELVAQWDQAAERIEIGSEEGRTVWRSWGRGRPLLLLHGGSGSWRHWIRNLGPLLPERRLLAPDLPGLGESTLPHPATLERVVTLVGGGLERLLPGGERCEVIGFSFGSLVAGGIAARLGERVSTLVLVGASGLGLPRGDVRLQRVRDKTGQDRFDAHRTNLERLMFADAAKIDDVALAIQAWNSDHARLRSVGLSPSDVLMQALRSSSARLCGIWGARDAVALPTLADRISRLQSLQQGADIRTVAGAGHWVAYEAADDFNAMVVEMLGDPGGAAR